MKFQFVTPNLVQSIKQPANGLEGCARGVRVVQLGGDSLAEAVGTRILRYSDIMSKQLKFHANLYIPLIRTFLFAM